MLLAILGIVEARRIRQDVRFATDPDLNSGVSASSAATLELKATLADSSVQELTKFVTQQMDVLITQMLGSPELQGNIRILAGDLGAMMSDPFLQKRAALVAKQLEKANVDADLQEQAREVLTQMQTMITDPRLQGEAARLAKQIEKGMRADGKAQDHAKTLAKLAEAMEAIMAKSRLHENAKRLLKELETMKANQNFQDVATAITQLMESLIADPNFQRHSRRIAARVETIKAHLSSHKTDGGPGLDVSSLAEVKRSSLGDSFAPPSAPAGKSVAVASRPVASQVRQGRTHMRNPFWDLFKAEPTAPPEPALVRGIGEGRNLPSPSGINTLPEYQQAAVVLAILVAIGAGSAILSGPIFDAVRGSTLWDLSYPTWPVLGIIYLAAGIAHFTEVDGFENITPPDGTWGFFYTPFSPRTNVLWTGVVEIFGGAWMLFGAGCRAAGIALPAALGPVVSDAALTLYLLTWIVTPANIYALTHGANFPLDVEASPKALAVRLAFQAVLLAMFWELAQPTLLDAKANLGLL